MQELEVFLVGFTFKLCVCVHIKVMSKLSVSEMPHKNKEIEAPLNLSSGKTDLRPTPRQDAALHITKNLRWFFAHQVLHEPLGKGDTVM